MPENPDEAIMHHAQLRKMLDGVYWEANLVLVGRVRCRRCRRATVEDHAKGGMCRRLRRYGAQR